HLEHVAVRAALVGGIGRVRRLERALGGPHRLPAGLDCGVVVALDAHVVRLRKRKSLSGGRGSGESAPAGGRVWARCQVVRARVTLPRSLSRAFPRRDTARRACGAYGRDWRSTSRASTSADSPPLAVVRTRPP